MSRTNESNPASNSLPSILLIIAGAATLIAILSFFTNVPPTNWWLYLVTDIVLIVAFAQLAWSEFTDPVTRIAALFTAFGWVMLALIAFVGGLPLIVQNVGGLLISIGGLVMSVRALRRAELPRFTSMALLATSVVVAILLISSLFGTFTVLAGFLSFLFGIGLVATGVLLYRRQ